MSKRMKGLGLRGVSRIYLSIRFMKLLSIVVPLWMCGCGEYGMLWVRKTEHGLGLNQTGETGNNVITIRVGF